MDGDKPKDNMQLDVDLNNVLEVKSILKILDPTPRLKIWFQQIIDVANSKSFEIIDCFDLSAEETDEDEPDPSDEEWLYKC
tara:strand:+ start:304 stop:546 length:243 start_codon:yes stop_codon:yes gene_type:complete